jgi:hypothetical protein
MDYGSGQWKWSVEVISGSGQHLLLTAVAVAGSAGNHSGCARSIGHHLRWQLNPQAHRISAQSSTGPTKKGKTRRIPL